MRFLFVFFIVIPLTEMLILFEVSDRIGGFTTLALVVATAVIGVQILKRQGLSTLMRAKQRLESGELPALEIVEGMMLAGAGALLLTPGFITDTIGFVFLTGPLRRSIARKVIRSGVVRSFGASQSGSAFSFHSSTRSSTHSSGAGGNPENVYEGEYSQEAKPPSDSLLDKEKRPNDED